MKLPAYSKFAQVGAGLKGKGQGEMVGNDRIYEGLMVEFNGIEWSLIDKMASHDDVVDEDWGLVERFKNFLGVIEGAGAGECVKLRHSAGGVRVGDLGGFDH